MAVARVEIEKFDGKRDFALWKAKIKALLGQQKAHKALLDSSELPTTLTAVQNEEMKLNAYGTLILNLSDNVIRQVLEEETTHKIWKKLESLYATKDLSNKMYLREKFFTYKMDPSKSLTDNLDKFKKIVSDFKSLEDKLSDDNEAFVLQNSLPEAYKEVKNSLKYGKDSAKTDVIISTLRTRELKIQLSHKEHQSGNGLFVKGKSQNNQGKNSSKSSSYEDKKVKQKEKCK